MMMMINISCSNTCQE